MHQTAQRNQFASTAPSRIVTRRDLFSDAGKQVATASTRTAVEAVQSERVSSDKSKKMPVRGMGAKLYPYQPGHQVALLHLQAEADALILKLQAAGQKRLAGSQVL